MLGGFYAGMIARGAYCICHYHANGATFDEKIYYVMISMVYVMPM
jgi:hypothetical protein